MATKKPGSTLSALSAQIAGLQAQADSLRKKEVAGVVAKIRTAITQYGLTPGDLGFGKAPAKAVKGSPGAAATKARKTAARNKPVRATKFADDQGHTWSGIGKRPGWFNAALASGKKPEELLAKPQASNG
jgi:DNA-binding protein H-NS